MPFNNTDKFECLTVYSGTCISSSLQKPESRNKMWGFFGAQWFIWTTSDSCFLRKWACWFYFSGLLLHKPSPPPTLSTIVFSLSRLKTHTGALTSKEILTQQGLSARLTLPEPLSWRSDFMSWCHQQPFMILLGLIPVSSCSVHPNYHPCSPTSA